MPPVPPQPVQLTCPVCSNNFRANVYTIVDVTQQPELKQALLSGQLNMAVCPNCRSGTMIAAPMIYHDAENQLFLVYFPQELNARPEEQERFIGDATNALMRSQLTEQPRGYLLNPRRFISLGSLVDTVLEAEGIPREALEQQRQRIDLISQLASALEDEAQFVQLVEQQKDALNYEFFATLSAFIDAGMQEGRADSTQILTLLRDKLVEVTGFSDIPGESDVDEGELNAAIERLATVDDDALEQAVAELRHAIDYSFFQAWTERIEQLEQAGQNDEAARLTARRRQILQIVEEIDKEAQALLEGGVAVLREIMAAPDMEAALRSSVDKLDEAFMFVLATNMAAAERAGQAETVAHLQEIERLATEIVQESLSPEDRFINELMLAETPQESTKLLRQRAAQVTPDFVKRLNELAEEQEQRGAKEVAETLRRLAREAGAMLF